LKRFLYFTAEFKPLYVINPEPEICLKKFTNKLFSSKYSLTYSNAFLVK